MEVFLNYKVNTSVVSTVKCPLYGPPRGATKIRQIIISNVYNSSIIAYTMGTLPILISTVGCVGAVMFPGYLHSLEYILISGMDLATENKWEHLLFPGLNK